MDGVIGSQYSTVLAMGHGERLDGQKGSQSWTKHGHGDRLIGVKGTQTPPCQNIYGLPGMY